MLLRLLTGDVARLDEDEIVLVVGGFGLPLRGSASARGACEDALARGVPATLEIETVFSADHGATYYAFASRDERILFSRLSDIQGVSRSAALGVLGLGALDTVISILSSGDEARLRRAAHVGPKTARRILAELDVGSLGIAPIPAVRRPPPASANVEIALRNLGYGASEITEALSHLDPSLDEAALLRSALARLSARA